MEQTWTEGLRLASQFGMGNVLVFAGLLWAARVVWPAVREDMKRDREEQAEARRREADALQAHLRESMALHADSFARVSADMAGLRAAQLKLAEAVALIATRDDPEAREALFAALQLANPAPGRFSMPYKVEASEAKGG
jgi:hypothetical protein